MGESLLFLWTEVHQAALYSTNVSASHSDVRDVVLSGSPT